MFKWLFGKTKNTVIDSSNQDCENLHLKPHVKSLLSRAEALSLENSKFLKDAFGKDIPYKKEEGMEERVKSAVLMVSFDITHKAMKKNNKELPLPTFEIDPEINFVLAFNFLILKEIVEFVSSEISLLERINELFVLATDSIIQMRPVDELKAWHDRALRICVQFEENELDKVKDFLKSNSDLTSLYIMQWGSDDQGLRSQDFDSLFASQLKVLLSAAS